jgi:hypothetical protein
MQGSLIVVGIVQVFVYLETGSVKVTLMGEFFKGLSFLAVIVAKIPAVDVVVNTLSA